MSSEYIYDRKAINLHGVEDAYTALFVFSHASNDGEHIPRWKLYAFSKKHQAMDFVVRCAHYCEDGLTRGAGGAPSSGRHEIGQWREAINQAAMITADCLYKFVDLVFTDKHPQTSNRTPVENALVALASKRGVILQRYLVDNDKHPVHTQITVNLAAPAQVDLVWDAVSTIKVPSLYAAPTMVNLGPNFFFRNITNALNTGEAFPPDPSPYVTQAVQQTLEMSGEKFFKFEFPVEGQADWKDTRIVVIDWQCRVLSLDPYGWFSEKLAALEAKTPGCAEIAFQRFKRILKTLEVTPVEQIDVVEVRPPGLKEAGADVPVKLLAWQEETVNAFFSKHGKQPDSEAVYTSTPTDHLQALCLQDIARCYMVVNQSLPTNVATQEVADA